MAPDTATSRGLFMEKLLTTEAFEHSGVATEEVSHYKQLQQSRADLLARRVPTSQQVVDIVLDTAARLGCADETIVLVSDAVPASMNSPPPLPEEDWDAQT